MNQPMLKSRDCKDPKDELYDWLNNFEFSKPKKNLARDFSDAVLMAELLKKHFPRFVELHNYPPANSQFNKLKNWITLNDKVLTKIGLPQQMTTLQEAASANKQFIEDILLAVKEKLDEIDRLKKVTESDQSNITITEEILGGTRIVELHITSTVPYEEHSLVLQELMEKKEEAATLQAKVSHLEAMLELKDQRITDLSIQLKRCTCHK
ncbi:sperm flagellar protein 1-like isoform X1 [Cimex lectularius]|uniref:Calponin-homology (CH) domain-containing protein n=1 Tax=Cimex lectularius TaxID=79782 RepID=A0A8I6RE70_CIMLE|nr:sperm flagellar protein 1-like isoform X1 [Cimex lectularius]